MSEILSDEHAKLVARLYEHSDRKTLPADLMWVDCGDSAIAICELSSELQTLRERVKWKPMESAPKDGDILDLLHKDGWRHTETWWSDEDEIWVPGICENDEFIGWMHCPHIDH